MRIFSVLVLALLAACGSGSHLSDGGDHLDVDLSSGAHPDLFMCDPECPTGFQSPTYCLSGATDSSASCGACQTVGKTCLYFEADLTCESDGKWHCSYCGGSNCGAVCSNPEGAVQGSPCQ